MSRPETCTLAPFVRKLYTASCSEGLKTVILCHSVLFCHSANSSFQEELVARLNVVTGFAWLPLICGSCPILPSRVTWLRHFSLGVWAGCSLSCPLPNSLKLSVPPS